MGAYNSAIITTSGQTLIANAISGGGTVTFSSMQASSYSYPEGTNIADLTSLQDVQQTVQPFSAQVFNDTMIQVSARFDNSEVSEAYLVQTIGIFAQLGEESPVLLAVVQATTPDQMPAQSAASPSAFIYNIQITVQQATSISVSVNPSGTATVQDILDLQQQINAKVQAIGGNVSDTVSDAEEPEDAIIYPDIPSTGGTAKTLFGYLVRWVKSLKADKVDSSGGDINGTKVSKFTSSSDPYPVPVAGDSLSTIMGKVVKFFSDIRSAAIGACYIGQLVSNNTTDNPNLPASAAAVYQEAQLRAQQIAQLNSEMITITIKDYEVTLTSAGGSSWGYAYGFSLVENGDLPTGTQLVIPIACGLKTNWNTTGMVSVHQNDFVRVASNTGGIFDLRLAFISLRAPD